MASRQSVGPKSRINITYKPATGDAQKEIELPLRMLVMGDFTGREDKRALADRDPISVNKDNFNEVMSKQKLAVDAVVQNTLSADPDDQLKVSLKFDSLKDFTPGQIAHQVPETAKMLELREALLSLKNDLNSKAFRDKLEKLVADPEVRAKLLEVLGKPE